MRIALISYEYPPETGFGGIGTYTHYHARALSRLGHEVHVFAGVDHAERRTYRDGNVTVTRLRKVGIVERLLPRAGARGLHWFHNRVQNASNAFAALWRELRAGRFDVVEMPECGAEGALITHALDLPTVVRLHSPAELIMPTYASKAGDRMLTALAERFALRGARAVSSCSHWLAAEVRRRGLVDRPITVIPNGIDLALFDQDDGVDVDARFGLPRDRLLVLFANRLEERKGIHVVRDMLVPVLTRHPHVTFVLAGADPDDVVARELQPLLREHGLEHGLMHLGKLTLPEVRACLKRCDVFLLPSIWENAPYSLLEAMASGKAILASDCGGIPEMLRHEVDGLLARSGDAKAFARAMDRLQGEATRRRFGRSARSRVEARFTDELTARRSLEFYEWALGAPAGVLAPGRSAAPELPLGPTDWFQAPWLRGRPPGERPVLAPAFADVSLDELAFVHAVLGRVYWSERGRGDADEAVFLDQLAALHRERASRAQAAGAEPAATATLALPGIGHPLFADEGAAAVFVEELWRLGERPLVADWLEREAGQPEFAERAIRSIWVRRLAIEGFRRQPGDATASLLRRVYRTVGASTRVVEQDRVFAAADAKGSDLAALAHEYGLHAPLQRPAVFPASRRRKPPAAVVAGAAGAPSAPTVTVIVPSYRHEAYVGRAIDSVLAQSHAALRLLVVDDCSPDGTLAAARDRAGSDARVEVRANERNLGLGASLAAALPAIDTPYVALLNSDDVFHPERLERCLQVLERDAAAQLVTTRIAVMDDGERRLTAATSCVLDHGAPAHQWTRWYERVTAAFTDEDWVSLPALLRHNHLATSSNVVCRTSFLREHADALPPLKYCLDWLLFLRAAVAGSLRCVPEALVGYRLHGANTVWFDDGARPGYVHEVNAVLADAMRALVARRREQQVATDAIAEELAGLLLGGVAAHGESDGASMLLAQLLAELDASPATFRSPQLVRLAENALQRHRDRGAQPATDAQLRLARHSVEALTRRARDLEHATGALRERAGHAAAAVADATVLRERVAELAELLHTTGAELAEQRRRADDHEVALATTRSDLGATAAELARVRIDADAAHGEELRLRDQVAELRELASKLRDDRARSDVEAAASRGRSDVLARQAAEADARAQHAERALAVAEAKARDAAQWVAKLRIEHRAELDRRVRDPEQRAGRLLRKLRLLGPLKTADRLWACVRIGAARAAGGVRKQLPWRSRSRVLAVHDGDFPNPRSATLAGDVLALRAAGFDARVYCHGRGPRALLAGAYEGALRGLVVSSLDRALLAGDRRVFADRRPDVVAALDAAALPHGAVDLVFPFARTARAFEPAYVHAEGLSRAACMAWGAGRLLGVRFGLRLWAADLPRLAAEPWRELAAAAATIIVASDAMAAEVRHQLRGADVVVVPPLVPPQVLPSPLPAAPTPAASATFLCVGPFDDARGLLWFADAARAAVDRGVDARFVVLGAEEPAVANLLAIDWMRGRLAALGLLERFRFEAHADPARLHAELHGATALVDVRSGVPPELPELTHGVVAAFGAAVPVIAIDQGTGAVLQRASDTLLVPRDDPAALAVAMATLVDPDRRAAMAQAARRRYFDELAPEVAAVELCARVRALRNAAKG